MAKATASLSATAAVAAALMAATSAVADAAAAPPITIDGWLPADLAVMPRMGETVMVTAQPGALLRNNETGGFIAAGALTPQTVTVTLLRRLQDGDLVLMVPAAS